MIFESHAHYDDKRYSEDRENVLQSLKNKNVTKVVNIGADIKSSISSISLAEKYDFIYATVGIHPHDVKDIKTNDIEKLKGLASHEKVVAIGEIGLDYYYENSPKEEQKKWFKEQIQLAKEVELPIVIHTREASKDTFDIIEDTKAYELGGVFHCFSGSKEMALKYVEKGFYIGVGGVITYKNARKLIEVVQEISLENILIETDSPYLSPVPNRGKRNDSTNLIYIIEEIAKIKNISKEEVIATTYKNGLKLFNIKR